MGLKSAPIPDGQCPGEYAWAGDADPTGHILDQAKIGSGIRVLDCGCGAGRFARMAADRGGLVAGIDAAEQLIDIAAERTPDGDFRTGDLEALPWPDDSLMCDRIQRVFSLPTTRSAPSARPAGYRAISWSW